MRESIHYKHNVRVYVPCFEVTNDVGSKTFQYSYSEAGEDLELVLSSQPDYVLVLNGCFDAKTQPHDPEIVEYNQRSLGND